MKYSMTSVSHLDRPEGRLSDSAGQLTSGLLAVCGPQTATSQYWKLSSLKEIERSLLVPLGEGDNLLDGLSSFDFNLA